MASPETLRDRLTRHVSARSALPWLVLATLMPFQMGYFAATMHIMFRTLVTAPLRQKPLIYNDFMVFWSVGRMLGTHHAAQIYDIASFSQWQARHLPLGIAHYLHYFYPPTGLVLPAMVAPFSFIAGFAAWTLAMTSGAILTLRTAGVPWKLIAATGLSVPCLYNMIAGQIGWLTDSFFIAGMLTIGERPLGAAGLFGLLAIKPQAGLLAPVIMLARRTYRAIPVGVGVAIGLAALATIIAGGTIWHEYINDGLPTAHRLLVAPFPTFYEERGISVFWMARSIGAPVATAGVIQAVSAAGAALWCWNAWRRPAPDRIALVALTASLTLLVTPYGYTTDLCGFSLMVAWLAWDRRRLELADVLMWMWPALCPIISQSLHLELTPLILLLGALRAWKRLAGIGTPAPACYPAPL